MPKIILDRQITDDHWINVSNEEALPDSGDIIVSQTRFLADTNALLSRTTGRLGVRVEPGEGIAALVPHLTKITLVGVSFPTFYDGRGLSYARELRERHGYQGQIRAQGNVIRDVVLGMHRCGINAFEIKEGQSPEAMLGAFNDFTNTYQGDVHERRPIYRRA